MSGFFVLRPRECVETVPWSEVASLASGWSHYIQIQIEPTRSSYSFVQGGCIIPKQAWRSEVFSEG